MVLADTTPKELILELVEQQPADSSYDEILKELAFARMVASGLANSRAERTISNEQMEEKIRSWSS